MELGGVAPRSRDLANFVAGTLALCRPGPPVGVAGARADQSNFSDQLCKPIFQPDFLATGKDRKATSPVARLGRRHPRTEPAPPCQTALAPPLPTARALPLGRSAARERAQIAFTRPETPDRSSMLGRYARPCRHRPGLGCQRERIAAVADAPCLSLPVAAGAERCKNNQKNRAPSAADVGSELTWQTPAWTRSEFAGSTNAHANRSQPIANIHNRSSGHNRHCRGEANSKPAGRPERRRPRGRG